MEPSTESQALIAQVVTSDHLLAAANGLAAIQRSDTTGLLLAILAAICIGSFGIFGKEEMHGGESDVFVMHFWACLGVVTAGVLALFISPAAWTPLGVASGVLLVISLACAFIAQKHIGLSVRTGLWNGTAILVSFFFGLLIDPRREGTISNLPLALTGLALLLIAVAGTAYAGQRAFRVENEREGLITGDRNEREQKAWKGSAVGLGLSITAGALGGLVLAPMQYGPKSIKGLSFLPSMAVGVAIAAPIVDLTALLCRGKRLMPKPPRAAALGFAGGFVWSIAIGMSILSVGKLGYALAYPITQSGMFVSGLWGMYCFNELQERKARTIYWASFPFLFLGVACLAFAR